MRSTRSWPAPWTASSSSTPTTSRMPRPARCGSRARPAQIPLPASPPASPRSGVPRMAGANEAVLKMLGEIGHKDNIPEFIAKVKDKTSHIRLMGFGHRVYRNYDPRAKIMERTCHEVLNELGIKDEPLARPRDGAGAHRDDGPLFRRAQAVSERRFLFGHHPEGDWASRRACSRCSSPWPPAPSAGSASGRRWWKTRRTASAVPARYTPARRGATIVHASERG